MKNLTSKLFNIDRRIIFVFIFLSILIPFLIPFKLPIKPGKNVIAVYDKFEELSKKKNATVLVSFDFDNASKAELLPMAKAIISNIFEKNIKLVVMGHWNNGLDLARNLLNQLAAEYKKEKGVDYVFLGYKPGDVVLIVNMGQDFKSAFEKDYYGVPTNTIPITKRIKNLADFDYIFSLSAGNKGIEEWVIYGQSKHHFAFGGGCTAVMAPDYMPFVQAGQMVGLIGGLSDASQFETLINKPGTAIAGMNSQSVSHLVLIFFIIFGNLCYFINKRWTNVKRGGA